MLLLIDADLLSSENIFQEMWEKGVGSNCPISSNSIDTLKSLVKSEFQTIICFYDKSIMLETIKCLEGYKVYVKSEICDIAFVDDIEFILNKYNSFADNMVILSDSIHNHQFDSRTIVIKEFQDCTIKGVAGFCNDKS